MATISSVLGPVDTADLGFTLAHEHILVGPPGAFQDYPELFGTNHMERVVEALKKAKEGGVDTIVDVTTLDLGRDINLMVEASRRSGVNIIACTGCWLHISPFLACITADRMAEVFIKDIEHGIAGTNIKAGLLKAASDMNGVTETEEIMLRAVARAHLKTGVPIAVHSYSPGQVGKWQLPVLKEEGVDPKRVKFDHSNDTTDVEYLTWLLEQGCYLGLDRYPGGIPVGPSSRARTKTLKALIDAGYAHRLCPSHDWNTLHVIPCELGLTEEEIQEINPHGYLYIKNVVFHQLREMGVSEAMLNKLCVDGPRNFFEGV